MAIDLIKFIVLLVLLVRLARQRREPKAIRTQGTPEIIVNGKYRVTTRLSKNFDGMLRVASFLIEKERRAGQ